MKRIYLLLLPATLLTVPFLFLSCSKNELGKSADSVKKLQTDFFCMTVNGSVGFERFIEKGGASTADEVSEYLSDYLSAGPYGKLETNFSPKGFACSALKVKHNNGEGYLVGRNYDWDNCTAMIIRNIPDSGYKSLSTVNLDFLGFGESYKPEGMINAFKATAGVYVPMDGINEKGLIVADLMAGDDEVTDQPPSNLRSTPPTMRLFRIDWPDGKAGVSVGYGMTHRFG